MVPWVSSFIIPFWFNSLNTAAWLLISTSHVWLYLNCMGLCRWCHDIIQINQNLLMFYWLTVSVINSIKSFEPSTGDIIITVTICHSPRND